MTDSFQVMQIPSYLMPLSHHLALVLSCLIIQRAVSSQENPDFFLVKQHPHSNHGFARELAGHPITFLQIFCWQFSVLSDAFTALTIHALHFHDFRTALMGVEDAVTSKNMLYNLCSNTMDEHAPCAHHRLAFYVIPQCPLTIPLQRCLQSYCMHLVVLHFYVPLNQRVGDISFMVRIPSAWASA